MDVSSVEEFELCQEKHMQISMGNAQSWPTNKTGEEAQEHSDGYKKSVSRPKNVEGDPSHMPTIAGTFHPSPRSSGSNLGRNLHFMFLLNSWNWIVEVLGAGD